MSKIVISCLAIGFVIIGSRCERAETFNLDEPFTLQLGEEKQSSDGDLLVQWEQLMEDSRCPKYTNCFWEGQATIKLLLSDEICELNLREGYPAQARQTINGYEIRAIRLSPYPEADQKIAKEDYVLEVKVSRKEP